MQTLDLFMRWLHIFSVITAVGSAIFMLFVLLPSLASLRDEDKATLSKNVCRSGTHLDSHRNHGNSHFWTLQPAQGLVQDCFSLRIYFHA